VSKLCSCFLFVVFAVAAPLLAQQNSDAPKSAAQQPATQRDGQRDFDFELGTWNIHLKRLVNPLMHSSQWIEFDGTSVTRKVWDGRSQLEEFETDGPAGHIEGLTLRLYNPKTGQWSLYWANSKDGAMGGPPNVGVFSDGVGNFYCQDTYKGKIIFVKYEWSKITPTSAHFEQSYSEDGGKTWEVNWITDQTRVKDK
jgi:hypothetical protein